MRGAWWERFPLGKGYLVWSFHLCNAIVFSIFLLCLPWWGPGTCHKVSFLSSRLFFPPEGQIAGILVDAQWFRGCHKGGRRESGELLKQAVQRMVGCLLTSVHRATTGISRKWQPLHLISSCCLSCSLSTAGLNRGKHLRLKWESNRCCKGSSQNPSRDFSVLSQTSLSCCWQSQECPRATAVTAVPQPEIHLVQGMTKIIFFAGTYW